MDRKYIIAEVSCISLLIVFIFTGLIYADININLGEITAREIVKEKFIIPLAYEDISDGELLLSLTDNEFGEIREITASRLTFIAQNGENVFSEKSSTVINENDLIDFENNKSILLSLTVYPYDKPGEYKRKILLKNIKTGEIEVINIRVRVKPWLNFRIKNGDNLLIKYVKRDSNSLMSSGGHILQVASNTEWYLYTDLKSEQINNPSVRGLRIILTGNEQEKVVFYTDSDNSSIITDRERLLAEGKMTVSKDSYWFDIPFILSIDDFSKIVSGQIFYPIVFSAGQFKR